MNSPKKILYIQHASSLGGSCKSLLYTMQNLDKTKYQPILALANKSQSVIDFYRATGFEPILCPEITFWNHSTAAHRPLYKLSTWVDLIKVIWSWRSGQKKILELVNSVNPDLVHLNSVVLSASATALAQAKIPFVWHIREHPPVEFSSIRTNIIRRLMLSCPNEIIFISEADRRAWVNNKRGEIIPNFINFNQFDRFLGGKKIKKELGLSEGIPTILYVGGLNKIKGIFTLIKALFILKKQLPQFYCLMPGSEYNPPNYWQLNLARAILPLVGSGTVGQRVIKNIVRSGLEKNCVRLPFEQNEQNIAHLIAACDVLIFPAITPHFARPIIEASAMAKPVVASRLDGIEELVKDGETGILVEPNNPEALAKNILTILTNREKAKQMGEAGYIYAKEKFSAEDNCHRIMKIYDRILKTVH